MDRGVLLPTAETHPAGTAYVSSTEIVLLQAGYAVTDHTQLTLSFVPPLTKDPIVPLDFSVKTVLHRGRAVRVAAMASATGLFGFEAGEGAVGRGGGVVQLCLDDACRSSVSSVANLALAGPAMLLIDGFSLALRTSDHVAVLAELQSVVPLSRAIGEYHALAGAFGVRFSGRSLALDLALEASLDRRTEPRALPFLAGTYRFNP